MVAVTTDLNHKGARVTWGYLYHTDTFLRFSITWSKVTCKGNNLKDSTSNLSTCLLFFIYITKRSIFICLSYLRSPPSSSCYALLHCSLLKTNFSSQLSLASQRDSFRRITIQQYQQQLQWNRNSNTAIHYQLAVGIVLYLWLKYIVWHSHILNPVEELLHIFPIVF